MFEIFSATANCLWTYVDIDSAANMTTETIRVISKEM